MSEPNEEPSVVARKLSDFDLSVFANLVNHTEVGVGLTLLVGGTLISGTLISGKKYYAALQERFSSYSPDSYGSVLKEHFSNCYEVYAPENITEGSDTADANQTEIPLNFIHLEDVSLQGGNGGFTAINGALLRLKIEEIDGHIFGTTSSTN